MNRERAFSAIIHNGKIVMVKVEEKDKTFWTLPGGGVETGESKEEAAKREAKEEVNLKIKVIRFLFEQEYAVGIEYCFLAEPLDDINIELGYDPELIANEQILKKVEWKDINSVKDDLQVSKVLESLNQKEIVKYNIAITT